MTREELIEYLRANDTFCATLHLEDFSFDTLIWLKEKTEKEKQKAEKRKRKQENPALFVKLIRQIFNRTTKKTKRPLLTTRTRNGG